MRIGVIGSGSWGTAIAKILTDNGNEIIWCVRSNEILEHLQAKHCNPTYLSSIEFDLDALQLTTNPVDVYQASDCIVFAVPSEFAASYIDPFIELLSNKIIASAVKGILPSKNMLMNEYVQKVVAADPKNYVAIMGPCHAEEVAAKKLSFLTFAAVETSLAEKVAIHFKTSYINTVISNDVFGVQYAAILKNVYALGTGILQGIGYGDNFQSVFVANAAGEMQVFLDQFEEALDAERTVNQIGKINYSASVYLGDLLVTCYSSYSRNRAFGFMIGRGDSVESASKSLQMVAEGYFASRSIYELNINLGCPMPIALSIYKILWEGLSPAQAFHHIEQHLV